MLFEFDNGSTWRVATQREGWFVTTFPGIDRLALPTPHPRWSAVDRGQERRGDGASTRPRGRLGRRHRRVRQRSTEQRARAQHRPRVEHDGHLVSSRSRSALRSTVSSSTSCEPLNRPRSGRRWPIGRTAAWSPWRQKLTWSPGSMPSSSRRALGMTTWPFGPTREVIRGSITADVRSVPAREPSHRCPPVGPG